MSGLLLCGKTAKNPLYIKDLGINLYSMEELCYYLYNNIYMIGPEFFNESLLKFIGIELELENITKILKDQMFRNESYTKMIRTVLENSYYYTDDEKEEVIKILGDLGNKSVGDRLKARADLLMEMGRYEGALKTYKMLLGKTFKIEDNVLIGNIWNNMGIIYGKLFLYEDAISCLKVACDLNMNQSYLDNLICCVIFSSQENEKGIVELEDIKIQYQVSDADIDNYKKVISTAKRDVEESTILKDILNKLKFDGRKELSTYYKEVEVIINQWKRDYREQIL